jgi:hypothetical protein
VWDSATATLPPELKAHIHLEQIPTLAFSPDGRHLASLSVGYADATLCNWDAADGSYISLIHVGDPATYLCFPGLKMSRTLSLPAPSPFIPPSPFCLDNNSLCIKRDGITLHLCCRLFRTKHWGDSAWELCLHWRERGNDRFYRFGLSFNSWFLIGRNSSHLRCHLFSSCSITCSYVQ